VGFGFGPIQAGLFAAEAHCGGRFRRIVVAEIDRTLIDAVRRNGGRYAVNVAGSDGIETQTIDGLELLDPTVPDDHYRLVEALATATEIVTSLPSVAFYDRGPGERIDTSPAALIAAGLARSVAGAPPVLIYAAENHNHAAELLADAVARALQGDRIGPGDHVQFGGHAQSGDHVESRDHVVPVDHSRPCQFLNTVIGRMSQVVTDPDRMDRLGLVPIAPGLPRAFLVERFNRILVSRVTLPDVEPGIATFIQKDDLLPFEEAKLYGHNAIHALLAYVGAVRGHERMADLRADAELMRIARQTFLDESGRALIARYAGIDPLFMEAGWRDYADDLLERMTNPWLDDTIERAGRDPLRKLGPDDRIFGTMRCVLDAGGEPHGMALAAAAAVSAVLRDPTRHGFDPAARITRPRELTPEHVGCVLDRAWAVGRTDHAVADRTDHAVADRPDGASKMNGRTAERMRRWVIRAVDQLADLAR